MEKMNQAFEKVRMLVGMEVDDVEEEESTSAAFMDEFNRNCTLSTKQRLYGFVTCLAAGLACTLLGWLGGNLIKRKSFGLFGVWHYAVTLALVMVLNDSMLVFFHPIKFGITFTFGNLLSLGSTAFLIGPKRQVTMMLDPVRIYATAIYLASIILALFCALYVHNKLLTLIAITLEFGALIWYSLSYIPFARAMVSKVMVSLFDTEF